MAVGDIITAQRYNNLQSRINNIFGVGSGFNGYGQTVRSRQLTSGTVISAQQMITLYNDMIDARIHQTGQPVSEIAQISPSDLIGEDTSTQPNGQEKGIVDYESLMTSIENDKFQLAENQSTRAVAIGDTLPSGWNTNVTHTITLTFENIDQRRYFFNAGSRLDFSYEINNATNVVSENWKLFLESLNDIKFDYRNIYSENGNLLFGPSYQTIISRSSGNFSFVLQARFGEAANIIELRSQLSSTSGQSEAIDALFIKIDEVKATGEHVSVQSPVYTSALSSESISYSIVAKKAGEPVTIVTEGDTVNFEITTTNVTNGTTFFWKLEGTTDATDFTSPISGIFNIQVDQSGQGFFTLPVITAIDQEVETENFKLVLYRGNDDSNPKVAESISITLNDATGAETYVIQTREIGGVFQDADLTTSEGKQIEIKIITNNIGNADTLTFSYETDGMSMSFPDFNNFPNAGPIDKNKEVILSFDIAIDDIEQESSSGGSPTFTLILNKNNVEQARRKITVNELEPTYTLSGPVNITENQGPYTYTVDSTDVPNGTVIYWRVVKSDNVGETFADEDFFEAGGSVTINNNVGTFTLSPINDGINENEESFDVVISDAQFKEFDRLRNVTVSDQTINVSYSLIGPSSINEGASSTYTVNTTGVTNGTVIYWRVVIDQGTGEIFADADFQTASGSLTINNNRGTFTLTPRSDGVSEGNENFVITISDDKLNDYDDLAITVIESTPAPTYSLSGESVLIEGQPYTYNVSTTNFGSGTLYWSVSASTSDIQPINGSVNIINNQGTFTLTPVNDQSFEGNESYVLSLRTNSISGTIVAQRNITITDPSITYDLSGPTTIDEGQTYTYNISTVNFGSGTLYWTISGTTADFSAVSGSVNINNNQGSFNITTVPDQSTEGDENFTLNLRTNSTSGTIVDTLAITLNDTSVLPFSPTYNLTSNKTSVDEGSSFTITLNTTNVDANTSIPYTITGITSSMINNTSLTGNFIVSSTGTASRTFQVPSNSLTSDSTFNLSLNNVNESISVIFNNEDPPSELVLNVTSGATSQTVDVNETINQISFSASGGSGNYIWSIVPSNASGLNFQFSGNTASLTGSFSSSGSKTVNVTVSDGITSRSRTINITVQENIPSLQITTSSIPVAYGITSEPSNFTLPYSKQLVASGGSGSSSNYVWRFKQAPVQITRAFVLLNNGLLKNQDDQLGIIFGDWNVTIEVEDTQTGQKAERNYLFKTVEQLTMIIENNEFFRTDNTTSYDAIVRQTSFAVPAPSVTLRGGDSGRFTTIDSVSGRANKIIPIIRNDRSPPEITWRNDNIQESPLYVDGEEFSFRLNSIDNQNNRVSVTLNYQVFLPKFILSANVEKTTYSASTSKGLWKSSPVNYNTGRQSVDNNIGVSLSYQGNITDVYWRILSGNTVVSKSEFPGSGFVNSYQGFNLVLSDNRDFERNIRLEFSLYADSSGNIFSGEPSVETNDIIIYYPYTYQDYARDNPPFFASEAQLVANNIYHTYLNRLPDVRGMTYWIKRFRCIHNNVPFDPNRTYSTLTPFSSITNEMIQDWNDVRNSQINPEPRSSTFDVGDAKAGDFHDRD